MNYALYRERTSTSYQDQTNARSTPLAINNKRLKNLLIEPKTFLESQNFQQGVLQNYNFGFGVLIQQQVLGGNTFHIKMYQWAPGYLLKRTTRFLVYKRVGIKIEDPQSRVSILKSWLLPKRRSPAKAARSSTAHASAQKHPHKARCCDSPIRTNCL